VKTRNAEARWVGAAHKSASLYSNPNQTGLEV